MPCASDFKGISESMCHFYDAIRTEKYGARVEFVIIIYVAEESMTSLLYGVL